jgi:hypothetical protein
VAYLSRSAASSLLSAYFELPSIALGAVGSSSRRGFPAQLAVVERSRSVRRSRPDEAQVDRHQRPVVHDEDAL